jgi:hypothetical protein
MAAVVHVFNSPLAAETCGIGSPSGLIVLPTTAANEAD